MSVVRAMSASLILGLTAITVPAAAQQTPPVQPSDFISTFEKTCDALGPGFSPNVVHAALKGKWDEFKRKEGMGGLVWIISVHGAPLHLDITDTALGRDSCFISADAEAFPVLEGLAQKFGRKPEVVNVNLKQSRDLIAFVYDHVWSFNQDGRTKTVTFQRATSTNRLRLTVQYLN